MGEKAATNEVISKLVSALGDESENVRANACEALGMMGEKAATNEVISKLVSALGDESGYVRRHVYKALGKMGEKAATNEVISKLTSIGNADYWEESESAVHALQNILSSCAVITQLDPHVIADLCLSKYASDCLKNASEHQLINFFFKAENLDWLSAVTKITFLKAAAITATEDKVVVYGSQEPLEICVPNSELYHQLFDAFTDQRKLLHSYF
jgi:hypothetical protein